MGWLRRQRDVHAVKLFASGAGEPDIVCSVGDRALWIELKTETGRLSELQAVTLMRIRAQGAPAIVARSLDEVRAAVEAARRS